MAQLRIRKKPDPMPRTGTTLVPMAAVLTAGVVTTLLLGVGTQRPVDLAREVAPAVTASWETLTLTYLKTQSYAIDGRAWVLAEHPPVEHFTRAEMVRQGQAGGWSLYANRERGLEALSAEPKAFDRLYLELEPGRYLPLRWRDVPRP